MQWLINFIFIVQDREDIIENRSAYDFSSVWTGTEEEVISYISSIKSDIRPHAIPVFKSDNVKIVLSSTDIDKYLVMYSPFDDNK